MIDSQKIYHKATKLMKKYGTSSPERLATELDIIIYTFPGKTKLLGMYTNHLKTRVIYLNPFLDTYMRKMVIAHELGHDQCHQEELKTAKYMQEIDLFHLKDSTEYEANAFAAHLLLDTDDVLTYAKQGYSVMQIAQMTNTDINLVLIKIQEMKHLGYRILLPMEPDSRFFKGIDGGRLPDLF